MRSFDDHMKTADRPVRVVAGGRGGWIGSVSGLIARMDHANGVTRAATTGWTPRNHPRRPAVLLPEVNMTCHVRGMS
jgi:hypothetical protein